MNDAKTTAAMKDIVTGWRFHARKTHIQRERERHASIDLDRLLACLHADMVDTIGFNQLFLLLLSMSSNHSSNC